MNYKSRESSQDQKQDRRRRWAYRQRVWPVGFTLLEVVVALAILVGIAFAIFQATQQTFRLREILSTEGDFYSRVRLASTLLWQDLSLIYSPQIASRYPKPSPDVPPTSLADQVFFASTANLSQTFTFWAPAIKRSGLRPSRFIGSDTQMSFIALSHIRMYRETAESEFAKITYSLVPDDKPSETKGGNAALSIATPSSGLTLVKTSSSNAFAVEENNDPFLKSYRLLSGIKTFHLKYYQRDGLTWKITSNWDSDRDGTRNQIPDAIELVMDVIGPKNQLFEGRYQFRPEIPYYGLPTTF